MLCEGHVAGHLCPCESHSTNPDPTVSCALTSPPPLPVTHSQRTPFINAAAVVILCCRRPDVVEGPCHHQSAAAKALCQPRDQIGIKAGTDLPPGLQPLVPGMQAYRSLEAGRRPHMTRLLDMPLAESCPLPFPGGRSAMALHRDRDLDVTFLGFLKGQGPTGVLPHQGQVKPQTDCLHQWQDEHQQLSGSHCLPELQGTILAGIRGCSVLGFLSEGQGQAELPQEQASLLAGEQDRQGRDSLGQGRHTQPHGLPLPGAELHPLLHVGTATPLW